MNALADVAPKLDLLIRRLASDQDGERLACVAAIQRQLDRAGLSIHDLADKLTSEPETPAQSREAPVFTDYAETVAWILAIACGALRARDINFCEDMPTILRRWPPTPRQAAWIRGLVEKLGGRFHG